MMDHRRIIRLYIAFQFFFGLLLWIPVFYEIQKRLGLNDPEIFHIQSVYYLVFCFLEVPTGLFADRFGYRASMRWGSGVLILANLMPRLAPNYAGFMTHFLMIALSRSLISGAASAYLYEYLKAAGRSDLYKKAEGDARFWGLVGKVVCWSGVGTIVAINPLLPYDLSALSAVLALGLAWVFPHFMPAGKRVKPAHALLGGDVMAALRLGLTNPLIIFIILQGIGIFVTVRILQVNLFQPILESRHFSVASFGLVMAMMTICEAIGSRLAPRAQSWLPDRHAVTLMTLVIGAAVGIIAMPGLWAAPHAWEGLRAVPWLNELKLGQVLTGMGLGIFSLAAGMAFPIQRQVLNDAIPEAHYRATLLSLESIVDRAVCALAVLPLGGLVAKGVLAPTLAVTAMVVILAAIAVQFGIARTAPRVVASGPDGQPA